MALLVTHANSTQTTLIVNVKAVADKTALTLRAERYKDTVRNSAITKGNWLTVKLYGRGNSDDLLKHLNQLFDEKHVVSSDTYEHLINKSPTNPIWDRTVDHRFNSHVCLS